VLGEAARLSTNEWDDDRPRKGDDGADQHRVLYELVGNRMQADQEDKENEHHHDHRAEAPPRTSPLEHPPSSNHDTTP